MNAEIHLGAPGSIQLKVAPWRGGKITSLRDRRGKEWLLTGTLAPARTGGAFVDAEMFGWDECAPTVDATTLPATGTTRNGTPDNTPSSTPPVALSDHGDLWDQAWEIAGLDDAPAPMWLTLRARGTDWPYEFTRTITIEGPADAALETGEPGASADGDATADGDVAVDGGTGEGRTSRGNDGAGGGGTVRLDYAVTSHDTVARPFLCVAHPQFVAPRGSRVEIAVKNMVRTQPSPETVVAWDPALPDIADGETGKWWSPADEHVTSGTLIHPDGGRLTVSARGDAVRWYGVWADGGVYAAARAIALEPATGWYDDTAAAQRSGRVLTLEPGETATWQVNITLS